MAPPFDAAAIPELKNRIARWTAHASPGILSVALHNTDGPSAAPCYAESDDHNM